MGQLGQYNKAWVALVMAILTLAEQYFGWGTPITEQWLTMLFAILSPILVWLVPNRS